MNSTFPAGTGALMRRSHFSTLSLLLPRSTRNCRDSGSRKIISTEITSGTMPPKIKTERHPNRGISPAAINPPIAAPTVKKFETSIITVTRIRAGLYSPARAMALGMMPPNPKPAMKRIASSSFAELALAVHSVSTAKYKAATISTGRRPILSESMLNKKDPSNTPVSAALNTKPICAPGILNSLITAGAT